MGTDASTAALIRAIDRHIHLAGLMGAIMTLGLIDVVAGFVALAARYSVVGYACAGVAGLLCMVYFGWIAGGGRDAQIFG